MSPSLNCDDVDGEDQGLSWMKFVASSSRGGYESYVPGHRGASFRDAGLSSTALLHLMFVALTREVEPPGEGKDNDSPRLAIHVTKDGVAGDEEKKTINTHNEN